MSWPPFPAGPQGWAAHAAALQAAARAFATGTVAREGRPAPAATPAAVAAAVAGLEPLPEAGVGLEAALDEVAATVVAGSVDPTHPACAAHLHCPPLISALAGEAVAAAVNASLDSWDQGAAGTAVEGQVVAELCRLVGWGSRADGVFTPGGTQSNLMGLLLAREWAVRADLGWDVTTHGLPPAPGRYRILCSDAAHFSLSRAASVLGLGERAVVAVPTDAGACLNPEALEETLDALERGGARPLAVVATAGTTDFGSIDPLPQIVACLRPRKIWLHVDAAYGGAVLLSERHRHLLDGLAGADSVAIDFHKLGWQPVACGVFLVRDGASFAPLTRRVAYLNPADDEALGYHSLLGKSLQTTRRADALKLLVTFRALGRRALGGMVEQCLGLARYAASRVAAEPRLEAPHRPTLSTLVFRYLPADLDRADAVNAAARLALLASGKAVVGRTEVAGRVHLKLTFLNPGATPADVDTLLDAVLDAATSAEHQSPTKDHPPLPLWGSGVRGEGAIT
ncbi:MAG TPA: aspartate aminotransferase family protein [Chloroflexota bacterium]|nr:aspartate aminotransferase family protein [Chloroflexota bacterium]